MLTNLLEKVAGLFIDSRTIPNVSTGGTAPSEAKKGRKEEIASGIKYGQGFI